MPTFPSGTVTFLFTDVEGSTRRWEHDSPAMLDVVERHFTLLDEAIAANNGVRFKTIGDAIQAAFPTAPDALKAAVAAQRALIAEDWGELGPLSVRMALHTGAAEPRDGDYLAPALNRLARLLGATAGGQIVLTEATRNLVRDHLPQDVALRNLGEHRLRDLREAEHVFQVDAEGLPTQFPPLQTVDRQMHNLPAQVTAFVGREQELADVKQRLEEPGVRLLTLTGPGGTGKTRLALQVAGELVDHYPDGVWFVPLAPIARAGRVASAIAEVLGVRESPGEAIADSLRSFLRTRRLLLVLDNFEHVADAAPLVADLLADDPGLQILVTSRTPLRLSGEQELPIEPLGLPSRQTGLRPEEALTSEAVRLFVDRAQAVRPGFTLTEQNVDAVVAICRRLDGLPLAIELAAARMRLLPPEAILSRLDSRLSLLTGGGRDRPERQQTLRAAIGWSHDLLDTSEQALFRRLAVFSGGWTLEAAEAVVNAVADPDIPVIDCLEALHANSLIRLVDADGPEGAADPRFAMLQTIREFAREQLVASGELDDVSEAHAAYFTAMASAAEPHLTGRDAATWLDRFETEHDNVRAALAWLRDQGHAAQAVRLAGALWRFWWLRGHIGEGRDELEAALALDESGDGAQTSARAAALDGAGVLAETQGDTDRAQALHEQALAISRELDDRFGIARALGNLGVVAFDRRDDDRAVTMLQESLTLARESGSDFLVATALNDLGRVAYEQGDLERAESLYRESLALRRRIGSESDIARALNNLGGVALQMGDFERAATLFGESLELYRTVSDPWGAAGAMINLALAARDQGDTSRATALFAESLELFRETGDTRNSALALLSLAETERLMANHEASAAHYREAIAAFRDVDDPLGVADGLAGLAGVLHLSGQSETAARVLAAATVSLPGDAARSLTESEQYRKDREAIRAAVGAERFAALSAEGKSTSLDDKLDEAVAPHDRHRQ
jgi:predicted ATPase/class 3 adenylate cyclase/Tfp pilus assembly protein PilF